MQRVLVAVVVVDGVPGICTPLCPSYNVVLLRQDVNQLPLSLVTPLRTQDSYDLMWKLLKVFRNLTMDSSLPHSWQGRLATGNEAPRRPRPPSSSSTLHDCVH